MELQLRIRQPLGRREGPRKGPARGAERPGTAVAVAVAAAEDGVMYVITELAQSETLFVGMLLLF